MIYIITALQAEASPFISHFKLQKSRNSLFPLFENSSFKLIVSGIGKVNAAIATTYLLEKFGACVDDTVLNIGTCTSVNHAVMIGSLLTATKLIDVGTQKVYHLPQQEGMALSCVELALSSKGTVKTDVADMESIGVYLAAVKFIPKSQIMIMKVVSDYTETAIPSDTRVKALLMPHIEEIEETLCL